ncbi:MAG TPA: 3-oxoacyl-ACP synthase [Actinomycetota bacterium]|nr:3-oxoacyl-ACP synthase [Actinomycetota bacterium]
MTVPVGIADLSFYEPERFVTSADLAAGTGIPESVIVEKFGLYGKHVAAPDEHVSDMCIKAAAPIVERHGADTIDAVAYFGSHWKDYAVWQVAPKIQRALGIEGFAFELVNVSAGAPVALKIVADMLRADDRLGSILLVGASRESYLIDYENERSRFMFPFGDGAVAVLLTRGHETNQVLASSLYTDGSFSDDIMVPGGGSRNPTTVETVASGMHVLDVRDPAEMKLRLDPITVKNFIAVAFDALERSGFDRSDADWLLPIHTKRSLNEAILLEMGIPRERSIYLDHHGHMSAVDPLFSLALGANEGRFRDGDVIVILAAGTGYTWAASIVRWGNPRTER